MPEELNLVTVRDYACEWCGHQALDHTAVHYGCRYTYCPCEISARRARRAARRWVKKQNRHIKKLLKLRAKEAAAAKTVAYSDLQDVLEKTVA
jgi:hypothetical protein